MNLRQTHPELAKQWHPTLNGELTPDDVSAGSNRKVWWVCPVGPDHVWQSIVHNRTRPEKKGSCSCCAGKTVVKSNCLRTTHPELAAQWHPTLNGDLTPDDVTAGSNRKVWWVCPLGHDHVWQSTVHNRTRPEKKGSCSCCAGKTVVKSNCLRTTHPELAAQWHPTLNGDLTPDNVTAGSNRKVWWTCSIAYDHLWDSRISDRVRGRGCLCCIGFKVVKSNCLRTTHPELADQWHPSLNGDLTPDAVVAGSDRKVWWICPVAADHVWHARITDRTNGNKCPCCQGSTVVKSNCLGTTNPELAKQWHPTLNGDLTPDDVTAGSERKVWWICPLDHVWEAQVNNRTHGRGCRICKESKGEKAIATVLDEKRLCYEREYAFPNCKDARPLRFDFAINSNGIVALIEYHGEQHYRPIGFGSSDPIRRYQDARRRDRIKRDWCKKNNVPYLEIPYWEMEKIPILIDEFIKELA